VDFDTQPELYEKYKVRTVPVVVYLKNNKEVYRKRGISTVDEIKENVDKYFK
jgi:thioredoxin-like negative regulator of GroEL